MNLTSALTFSCAQGLMDDTTTSYQSMGESSKAAEAAPPEDGTPAPEDEGHEEASDSYKLSPLTTIVAYITKQSYMVALILMMVRLPGYLVKS